MTTRSSERASMMSLVQAGAPPQAGISLNTDMAFDLPTLIETRLIVQANSGGGKSWALRRILEQSHGRIQQMVIDVEGGFRSLRETYAYLLLGSEEARSPTATCSMPFARLPSPAMGTHAVSWTTAISVRRNWAVSTNRCSNCTLSCISIRRPSNSRRPVGTSAKRPAATTHLPA